MAVVSVILGVLLVICGFSIMWTPLLTFLGAATLLSIVLMVWGIMALVKCISTKMYGFRIVLAILAIVFGFILMISPRFSFFTDVVILYFAAAFLIARGLLSVILAIKSAKGSQNKMWTWGIVLGILAVILGIICFAYPLFEASLIGFMIAFYFIYAGFDLMYVGFRNNGDGGDGAAAA